MNVDFGDFRAVRVRVQVLRCGAFHPSPGSAAVAFLGVECVDGVFPKSCRGCDKIRSTSFTCRSFLLRSIFHQSMFLVVHRLA